MLGGVVVAKGLNAEQRAVELRKHWMSMKDPVAVLLDVSRFDQHVSKPALEWEHGVYSWFFPQDADFRRMLCWMRQNIGYARTRDGTIKYKLDGKRMSGDMSTSLGNVLLMTAVLVSYLWRGYRDEDWRVFDDGDDCVLLLERSVMQRAVDQLPGWYKGHGFKLKIEQVTDVFEQIQFCQSSPVETANGWRMVRDPAICLEKDLLQVKMFRTQKQWEEKMVAIAGCGLALAGDVPIYWVFYSQLARFGAQKSTELVSGMDYLAYGLEQKCQPPSDEARVSFFRAFGISPHEQLAVEEYYRGIRPEWCEPVPLGKVVRLAVAVLVNKEN
jgi:hypothetical protein